MNTKHSGGCLKEEHITPALTQSSFRIIIGLKMQKLLLSVTFVACFMLGHCSPHHKPLQILTISNGTLNPNTANLQFIMSQVPRNMEVAVLSIAGEMRKGKSFVLNFFLQYLKYRARHDRASIVTNITELEQMIEIHSHPWLRNVNKSDGFNFKSGNERDTVGVKMWSEPFVVTKANGKPFAVLIIDSQGLYDPATTPNDNVRIFTMVSLLSSSLMLNTPQNINLNQLSELKYFMDYASIQSRVGKDAKNFQRLTFLIRDYSLGDGFGWESGQAALDYFIQPSDSQSEVTKSIAHLLKQAFEKIDAFALPYPGSKVTNKKFDGALEKIDIDFLLHLQDVVSNIVEGSEPKKRLGMNLIAGDVESYVQDIANIFNNQLPPDEIMKMNERQVTMRAYNETQMQVDEYRARMQAMFQDKNDTFFENTTENGLLKAIMQMHEETSTSIVSSFASNSYSGFLTHTDTNGSAVSAHQWLERTISDQFEIIRPRLMSIANERTAAIILKRKAEEERLRLDQEQQRLAKEKAEKEAEVRRLEVEAEQKRKEREQIEKQRQEAEAKVKLQQVTLKQAEEQAARDKEERERLEKQQAEMAEAHRKQQELIAEKSRQAEIDRLDRERIEQERKRLEEQNRKQEQELAQKLAEAKEQQRRDNEMRDRMHRMEVEAARMAERVRAAERNRCRGLGCLFG